MKNYYYYFKPFIPRSMQLATRRILASSKRRKYKNIWPIDRRAGDPPKGWTGWPEGKRFALVLSHDVDRASGVERALQLAEMEVKLGFRSSFNFVPEGYRILDHLRASLQEKGFEVAVHGLCHDGKLYWSRKIFEKRAKRINHYLKQWAAVGFHSPSMHRNLDWLQDLEIEYDQSTFDTDPFEPQPDGVGTIFPFAVYENSAQAGAGDGRPDSIRPDHPDRLDRPTDPTNPIDPTDPIDPNNCRNFYVELPYTLPQDHALFVIMRERDISIWKEKLDWIADKGGMALLNTHPDYMNFDGRRLEREEYPAKFYAEFLEYVQEKYQGQYWHVLPREIARFWRKTVVPGKT